MGWSFASEKETLRPGIRGQREISPYYPQLLDETSSKFPPRFWWKVAVGHGLRRNSIPIYGSLGEVRTPGAYTENAAVDICRWKRAPCGSRDCAPRCLHRENCCAPPLPTPRELLRTPVPTPRELLRTPLPTPRELLRTPVAIIQRAGADRQGEDTLWQPGGVTDPRCLHRECLSGHLSGEDTLVYGCLELLRTPVAYTEKA